MRGLARVVAMSGVWLLAGPALAKAPPTPPVNIADTVNEAAPNTGPGKAKTAEVKGLDPVVLKAQILLDRARFSPGAIDGRRGDNFERALAAFRAAKGLPPGGELDETTWAKLTEVSSEPAVVTYTITGDDVKGPFLETLPAKMEDKVGLKHLDYTSATEMLAEKFHMTEPLLKRLNPGKSFDQADTEIVVPGVTERKETPERAPKVARIEVDKAQRFVRAFAQDGTLVAAYPASIGSAEKPAPSGTYEVTTVAMNPDYTYNPDYAFKGVKATRKLHIAPGPNNPVGLAWIDLNLESYGIHGTPEPERVGKSYSHGCVRLTNWDVRELAGRVQKGTKVDFLDPPVR